MATYLNKRHNNHYILYNFYPKRQFEKTADILQQVNEVDFPGAELVDSGSNEGLMHFRTVPPNLKQLVLIIVEMASWLTASAN